MMPTPLANTLDAHSAGKTLYNILHNDSEVGSYQIRLSNSGVYSVWDEDQHREFSSLSDCFLFIIHCLQTAIDFFVDSDLTTEIELFLGRPDYPKREPGNKSYLFHALKDNYDAINLNFTQQAELWGYDLPELPLPNLAERDNWIAKNLKSNR